MQSAYHRYHSIKTAVLYVQNDFLCALDEKKCVVIVIIGLSTAVDMVNHAILLQRLTQHYRITGSAHAWLRSYLTERKQFVTIKVEQSEVQNKYCDVPQGSVLGSNLYEPL